VLEDVVQVGRESAQLLAATSGQPPIAGQPAGTREVWIQLGSSLVTSPSGPTIALSEITYGFNYAGADCFASMFAVGA